MNIKDLSLFQELKSELLNFNLKDSLVSLDQKNTIFIKNDNGSTRETYSRLIKSANAIEKESGIYPLCLGKGLVKLEINNSTTQTPILLFEIDRIYSSNFNLLEITKTSVFPNPFLMDYLNKNHQILLNSNSSAEEIFSALEEVHFVVDRETEFIGNFHPFRYELLKDLTEIEHAKSISYPLSKILGFDIEKSTDFQFNFSNKKLFKQDLWQTNALNGLKKDSVIIQGPPGTGKSQLIANVTAQTILNKHSILITSEKQAALEIIKSKFKDVNLDFLCFVYSSRLKSKEIILELKNTWDIFNKREIIAKNTFKANSIFENQLNHLLSINFSDDIEFISFLKEQNEINFKKSQFLQDSPSIEKWKTSQNIVSQLTNIDFELIKFFNFHHCRSLIADFESFEESIRKYQNLTSQYELNNWHAFIKTMKKAAVFQQFKSDIYNKYKHIINQKTKQFEKLRTSFIESQQTLKSLKTQNSNWIQIPTSIELDYLKESFNSKTFLGKLKWKKTWKKWSRTPEIDVEKQLIQIEKFLSEERKLTKIKKSLFQLGIEHDNEIELIHGLLKTIDKKAWDEFNNTPENERESMSKIHSELHDVYQLLKNLFHFSNDSDIRAYFSLIIENSERFSYLIQLLKDENHNFIHLLKKSSNLEEAEATVYKSAWINFTLRNPEFLKFNFNQFIADTEFYLKKEVENQQAFAIELANNQLELFQNYHHLISTPNSKLNDTEKVFKSTLKTGKAILVKEFGKQRNHLSLRQLFNSEAKHWLQILKPVWLTNPIALATLFPVEKEMFDLVIFDEASQIPLSHSIGALQRAKRVLIAGDNQQMGPSSFFSRQNENVTDLLHQASYYYKNITLCGHYRSKHASLIDFSNRHFYNNQLEVFEDFNKSIKNPISFNYIENGIYCDNKNPVEAREVAKFIHSKIKSEGKIGIVAFSEIQLAEIYQALDASAKQLLDKRIENNEAFFKALEHVQGDECDHLIISFGYGYNPDGKFEMRFGPVNKINGDKRLNVLFSRSREQITFFASVKSNDFKHSENSAIQLLKNWFQLVEKENTHFVKTNEIFIEDLIFNSKNMADFTSKFNIYKSRNWNIKSKYHDFPSRLGTGS